MLFLPKKNLNLYYIVLKCIIALYYINEIVCMKYKQIHHFNTHRFKTK